MHPKRRSSKQRRLNAKRLGFGIGGSVFTACVSGQQYLISTIVGGAAPSPVSGTAASVASAGNVGIDASGNVYFSNLNSVFKLDRNGVMTAVAGNSRAGYTGDGGPATSAELNGPEGVRVDGCPEIFI